MSGMPVTTGLSARTRYLTTGRAAGIWLLRVAEKILHRSIDHALTRGLRRIDHDDGQAGADQRAVHFGAHFLWRPNEQDQFGSCPRLILMREGLYPGQRAFGNSSTRVGWTVGAGVEGVVSGNWTAKVEYLYIDLGNVSGSFTTPIVAPSGAFLTSSYTSHITDNILRVGLNYKLGGPVVAKH